jgi:hypothetical protein
MKQLATHANRLTDYLIAAVLVLEPFYAFITIWGSTILGHYTALRLWDDTLLLILVLICFWWLIKDAELRGWFSRSLLVRLILLYVFLSFVVGFVSLARGDVTHKAFAYGLLINLRFPVWFMAVLLAAQRSTFLHRAWFKLVLTPAAIVVVFGVLQYTVLPHNFLSHFGYNAATNVAPIETINHNDSYIRVQSTLRGANPLGAYLVIIVSAIAALLVQGKRKLLLVVLGVVTLGALYASGSRSAWIGAVLSLSVIAWSQLKTRRAQLLFGGSALLVVVVALAGYVIFKNNTSLQNEVLHTQTHSVVKTTSDGAHASAMLDGLKDIVHQPFGDGPGTAGPASVYNGSHPARIAENYYIQIGQEVGWLGVAVFLCILTLVGIELYEHAGQSPLTLAVFASFIGLAFVNFLSHAWADDTLAYVWWGLAAIALARQPKKATR